MRINKLLMCGAAVLLAGALGTSVNTTAKASSNDAYSAAIAELTTPINTLNNNSTTTITPKVAPRQSKKPKASKIVGGGEIPEP